MNWLKEENTIQQIFNETSQNLENNFQIGYPVIMKHAQ